jgi:hypothetical protein
MSRNTVDRLMRLTEPPRYDRKPKGSLLDPFKADIAEMLEDDAEAPATVILERLQDRGYKGRITILKDYLKQERPRYLARRTFQRTSYLPGEIASGSLTHQGSSGFGFDCLRASAFADLDPARLRPRRYGNLDGEDALIVGSSDGFPIQSFSEKQLTAEPSLGALRDQDLVLFPWLVGALRGDGQHVLFCREFYGS